MKKLLAMCLASVMLFAALTACGSNASVTPDGGTTGKVVVNIEGTVTAVNGSEFTLDSGKVVVISADTVFAGDRDTNNAVSEDIAVGNFVQGYTKGDPDAERVSADKIYCNTAVQPGGGKLAVNFEGTVASVEETWITLENGQVILVTDDTVFSIASGVVENIILLEGDHIQGCTNDDPAASEITASRIHFIAF